MRLAGIRGTRITINNILLGIIAICIYLGYGQELFFMFLALLFHEISHIAVLTALHIKIHELELFPFGGVARLDNPLEFNPKSEVLVSAIGPATSLCIALLNLYFNDLNYFGQINLTLGLVNLLPILPLDGGRLLRAIFAINMGFGNATVLSIRLSKAFSIFLIISGVFLGWRDYSFLSLVIIGCFTFHRAYHDSRSFGYSLRRFLLTIMESQEDRRISPVRAISVRCDTVLKSIVMYLVPSRYHIFYIIDDKLMIIGTITEADVIRYYVEHGSFVDVSSILVEKSGKDSHSI